MFILLIVEKLRENRCWYLGWLLDGVGYTFPISFTHFFENRMTMAESRMTPRWRGHCFCCMTLFGLLTFFLSVENSRRHFTTESESDHCERKTEFVFMWQCQLGLLRRHCNIKSIKIKHILLVDGRARVVWCLLCLKSMYIFPEFCFVD